MIHFFFPLLVPFVNGDWIVRTNSGPVRGISTEGKNVEAFLGIPFAEPPVRNLRFSKPVSKSPWTEIFDAKELPPACIQPMIDFFAKRFNQSDRMDEDCLYLNLWVPRTTGKLKPIMVFFYGGGFMSGSSSFTIYDGAALSNHGDVIVMTLNYRVGTLGFFSAFTDDAAGSMGMYDQVLALKWIKDNAKHFGGDPDNIVIFGESAGAFSVSLHIVSPLSRNLFNRAILQSGAAINPMYSSDNAILRTTSQVISKVLGCADNDEELTENPQKVVECLKGLPPEKFPEADETLFKKLALYVPRVGDEFLPMTPVDLYRKGEFKDTEMLLGITRDEGSMFMIFMLGYENGDFFGETIDINAFNESRAKEIVQQFPKNEDYDKIVQSYFQRVEGEARYTYLDAMSDIVGDSFITCSTVFQADFQSLKKQAAYFYLFDYRSPSSPFPEWAGVPHFEEVPYVFGNPVWKPFSESEERLSKDIMNMWVTFAKTGNPSIKGGLKWPKYTYENPKYLIIGMKDKVGERPDNYRCEVWRDMYQSTIDDEVNQVLQKSKTEL